MKNIFKLFLIFTLSLSLSAKSFLISSIPLPKTEVLDIELDECGDECLYTLLKNGEIFSFLAKAKKIENENLKEEYQLYASLFNIYIQSGFSKEFKIAIISPTKKIGKYAKSTIKSVISYLLMKNVNFYVKTYEIQDENIETLQATLETIENEKYDLAIAPLTLEGAQNISMISTSTKVYIPTINKNDIAQIQNQNLFFGGIDYKAQIQKLLDFSNSSLRVFYDEGSPLAQRLTSIIEENSNYPVEKIGLSSQVTNLKRYFYKNSELNESSIFLNTSIVKSSLIMSQLTLYDLEPKIILSTQINYNPLIFSLTQYRDRKNLIIANSIYKSSDILEEINSLLNNDITFNWINYSTSIGVDFFYSVKTYSKRVFSEEILDNQVIYKILLEKALIGRFKPLVEEIEIEQETPYQ